MTTTEETRFWSPDKLREGVEYLDACLAELHQDENGNVRELDVDEQKRFDDGIAERKRLIELIERHEALNRLAKMPSHHETTTPDPLGEPGAVRQDRKVWDLDAVERDLYREAPEKAGPSLRDRAFEAVEKAHVNDKTKAHISRMLGAFDVEDDQEEGRGARKLAAHIVTVSSPEYQRAWTKAFKTGQRFGTPDVNALQTLQRAMSLTDASGGFAVPLPVDPTLILDDDGTVSPFREISTVRTIVTDALKTVSSGAVTASYDAEAAEVSDDATTFADIDITMRMARAFIPHSIEIGMDYPGFTEDIRFLLADSKMQLEDRVFVSGASGSNEPIGIVTALTGTSSEISENTTETFAIGDVYDLDEELPARFSRNATWVAEKSTYQAIREAGGANLDDFWVNLGGGRPAEMLGHPTREASEMDPAKDIDASSTDTHRPLILGDFRWFWIVDRAGFAVELVPHLFATANNLPSGQRGVFAWWRNGSDSVLDRAFRMQLVTTTA